MKKLFPIFVLLLFSCVDKKYVDPAEKDVTYFDQNPGDELATCMTSAGDDNVLFVEASDGFYLRTVSKDGSTLKNIKLNNATLNFKANGIQAYKGKYVVFGESDGSPAFGFAEENGNFILTASLDIGQYYDAIYKDGSLYLCGEIEVNGNKDILLLKQSQTDLILDTMANFGTAFNDGGVDFLETSDGDVLMLAYTYGGDQGDRDYFIYEMDLSSLGFQEIIRGGLADYDQPEMMLEAYGNLYVCGHTTSFGDPMHDALIVCYAMDSKTKLWEKGIKLDGHEGADFIADAGNSQIAMCSYGQMNPIYGGYFLLIDKDGNVLYQNKYPKLARFYQLRCYPDRIAFLGQIQNDDLDVAVHYRFY